ncbi:LON peptidase N-terminal domain and RING finger protein 1-like [Microcaecilia unicolor]|uniref:LON peptidase N-terminal domain and RING finger protein 1-like n=1 Tax=Microcaecilia unicolor TaxID=1415580 RepID=A0A6P7YXL6_9AMPH|nr:LON peptidase N-terminal domain and RING finger protein 1-like [Microcaecilia unicolor]
MELFRCPACRGCLLDPATVFCGHSFCKRCLGKTLPSKCQACGQRLKHMGMKDLKNNVVLVTVLDKYLHREAKVSRLKSNLQELMEIKDYEEALKTAQKGVEMAPEDMSLRIWCSEVYTALKKYPEALEDLEIVCKREAEDFEGFYQKGKVFLEMGEKVIALYQFHHCLTLTPHFPAAQKEIVKVSVMSHGAIVENQHGFKRQPKFLLKVTQTVYGLLSAIRPMNLNLWTTATLLWQPIHKQQMFLVTLTLELLLVYLKGEEEAGENHALLHQRQLKPFSAQPWVSLNGEERNFSTSREASEPGEEAVGYHFKPKEMCFADFGCILEIQTVAYLADGRSHVETIGRQLFRVLRRAQRDGYHNAEEDKKVEDDELAELYRLHDHTYQQVVERWISENKVDFSRKHFLSHGPLPAKDDDIQASPDGPAWCWWLLAILPLDPTYQMLILSMTSLKDRLTHMKLILDVFLQNHT